MNEQETRDILHQFAITYDVSSKESRNKCIDQCLKSLEPKVDEIANILAKELPVNYDGTNPGNWHILVKVASSIVEYLKRRSL